MGTKYKDSGIPWIGMIPSDWCLLHFKYSGSFEKGKLPNSTNVDGKGFPIIGASEMNGKPPTLFTEQQDIPMCGNEDVLILWDGANAGLVANNLQGIVSSTVVKYSCNDNRCNVQYVYYQYKTLERYFKSKVSGTTIPHMNMKFINGSPMLLPPLPTQQRIADFLDRKCAEIDELAALKENMIAELKRYKQSVITEAVTKGLDPDVPMKDSGVEWIGEIPEKWEVPQLKFLTSIISKGATPTTINIEAYSSEDVRFIKCENIVDNRLVNNSCYYITNKTNSEMLRSQLLVDDILFVIAGATLGKTAILTDDFVPSNTNQAVSFIRLRNKKQVRYIWFVLQSDIVVKPTWINAVQSAQPNLSMEDLGNLFIPTPPLNEQRAIADHLDKKCAEIDELIAIKQQKIEALKAYKKSVIFEYVTGKKEVL